MQGQSQRGGFRGGKRGKSSGSQGQSQRGGFKGGRRGKSSDTTSTKSSTQTKTSPTKQDRTKELKALDKIRFDKKTAFQTKKGFLKDKFGNIVRSKNKLIDLINKKLLLSLKEKTQI